MKTWKTLTMATLLASTLNFSAQATTSLEASGEPNIEVNKNSEAEVQDKKVEDFKGRPHDGKHHEKFEEFKQKREEKINTLPKKQQKEIRKLEEAIQEKRDELHGMRKELFDKYVEYGVITEEEAQQIKEHHKQHHHHSAK